MNIYEKLLAIQTELKAPKKQFNKFGGYKYRSCEDILEAVKPICKDYKTVLVLNDTLEHIGDRYYIKATAILYDIEAKEDKMDVKTQTITASTKSIINTAYAREEETKKGMDGSQITGTASSYARKYALNGLFNIDDTKDADTDEFTETTQDLNEPITEAQAKTVYAIMKQKGLDIEKNLQDNYGISNTKDLTKRQYASVLNAIKSLPNKGE